jgi:urease accessory protein
MRLVESVIGNVNDPAWQARLADIQVDHLDLDQWEAQKNRLRKHTAKGIELALSLDRNQHLHDGDILIWDETTGTAVVARIQLNDVMVIRLNALLSLPPVQMLRTCVELGHALGNQHWPAVVKENQVFVPLTVDRKVMASVMRTHAFQGIEYYFLPGVEVIPYLAPHEARRLFGGADSTPHSHLHAHEHKPGGGNGHSHS